MGSVVKKVTKSVGGLLGFKQPKMPKAASVTEQTPEEEAKDYEGMFKSLSQQRTALGDTKRKTLGRERARLAASGLAPGSEAFDNALAAVESKYSEDVENLMGSTEAKELQTGIFDKYGAGQTDKMGFYEQYFQDPTKFQPKEEKPVMSAKDQKRYDQYKGWLEDGTDGFRIKAATERIAKLNKKYGIV